MSATKVQDDRRCFACGPENPSGLQLVFDYGDGVARANVTPAQRFTGWSAVLHGGIVVTLLDEAMAHAAISQNLRAVTAKLDVRFRRAVPAGVPLVAEGRVEHRRGRLLQLSATLTGADGTLYAHGNGRFLIERE